MLMCEKTQHREGVSFPPHFGRDLMQVLPKPHQGFLLLLLPFVDTGPILKFRMKWHKTYKSKNNLLKGRIKCTTLLDSEAYYIATVVKTVWYW